MNIVVIGGSEKNKFGNDFLLKATKEGHTVYNLSHRNRPNLPDNTIVCNFSDINDVRNKFNDLVRAIDHIDIVLYNTNPVGYPNTVDKYRSDAEINVKLYQHGFSTHVIAAHVIAVDALKKMSDKSKFVFMTTEVVFEKERYSYIDKVGYYGGKAYQHQLMLALAHYNDKKAVFSAVSPFFDYTNDIKYKERFQSAYEYIMTHDRTYNGRVFDCFD